jgi:hypothetical protein
VGPAGVVEAMNAAVGEIDAYEQRLVVSGHQRPAWTTTLCSARWKCSCSDRLSPGVTAGESGERFTWRPCGRGSHHPRRRPCGVGGWSPFRRSSDEIECHLLDRRQIGGRMIGPDAALVVSEDHVSHPMQVVLDGPMTADDRAHEVGEKKRRSDAEAHLAAIRSRGGFRRLGHLPLCSISEPLRRPPWLGTRVRLFRQERNNCPGLPPACCLRED